MEAMAYLLLLDRRLSEGARRLPEPFRLRQTRFVTGCRQSDGGFAGRAGPSDLYYTRFALDALTVLGVPGDDAVWHRAADYLRAAPPEPADLPDCLSLLHSIHLLEAAGASPFCCDARRRDGLERVGAYVRRCRAPDGGYAATPGGTPGPYHTFLAALCCELLGEPVAEAARAADFVLSCSAADGGFAEAPGRPTGQTSPTAAAGALLLMAGRLDAATARGAACFLMAMQADDGGLKAHAAAPSADLLSTFTGLVTLASIGELHSLRLGPAGRFVRSLALPAGGFSAAAADTEADVEYAFYGLGSLALLAEAAAR